GIMPAVWLSLKKSLRCKSNPHEVEEPQSMRNGSSLSSRSLANHLKDVFRGSKRNMHHNGNCSPCSIASTEFLNNTGLAEEAMILKDYSGFPRKSNNGSFRQCGSFKDVVIRPRNHGAVILSPAKSKHVQQSVGLNRKQTTQFVRKCEIHGAVNEACTCLRYCSQRYINTKALESLNLRSHAVSVLKEGDSTRNVVEIIFKSSWLESKIESGKIERVFKVNPTHNTLARFEEYRETVKSKASKLAKKHSRCLADGNEVLSFHGTTIMCSLGTDGFSTLCSTLDCNVCNIIRTGFPTKQVKGKGIYTAATSLRAHNSINMCQEGLMYPVKRAMMICRVIAGRVHKPLSATSDDKFSIPAGFDSVAGEVENCSKLEEIYVANPIGVLPCFFVVYS
ncbi:hypothetical protein KI387_000990, partial [Taxus chinensis]